MPTPNTTIIISRLVPTNAIETVVTPIADAEPAPEPVADMYNCDHCGNDRDANAVEYHSAESAEYICQLCINREYVWSSPQDTFIRRSHRVSLYDGDYVSREYAHEFCYQSNSESVWFRDESERDEYDEENGPQSVYGYHATNPIDTHGWPSVTPRHSLCFGIELEMEHKDISDREGQEALSNALGGCNGGNVDGQYILMSDGSLDPSGVELITCPYTLDYHQKSFGWSKLLDSVKRIGRSGKDTESCGMHVHVNRAALSALTLGKMLVFVNAAANTSLIEKIAQRNPEEWARRNAKRIRNGKDVESDKYEAMHLARRTVEFRIFRGNLRPDRVLKNIEFCHAVTMYCKATSMQDLEKPALFVSWLSKNKGTYPNLAKFLTDATRSRLHNAANAGAHARPSTTVTTTEEL